MKISRKLKIATIAVIWIPCLIGLLLWGRLPEQVPTHWNFYNEIDGWSHKGMLVFGMPAFMTAMQLFILFMYQNDPKKKNISKKLMGLMSLVHSGHDWGNGYFKLWSCTGSPD